jgi:serine protease inhibitor
LSMVLILPNKKTGLTAQEEQLFAKHQIFELLQRASSTEVEVYLPKFKVETSLDLEQYLRKVQEQLAQRAFLT